MTHKIFMFLRQFNIWDRMQDSVGNRSDEDVLGEASTCHGGGGRSHRKPPINEILLLYVIDGLTVDCITGALIADWNCEAVFYLSSVLWCSPSRSAMVTRLMSVERNFRMRQVLLPTSGLQRGRAQRCLYHLQIRSQKTRLSRTTLDIPFADTFTEANSDEDPHSDYNPNENLTEAIE